MNSDASKKLSEMLSGIDKGKLDLSKKSIESFLNSPEGKRLKNSITDAEKRQILSKFMSMDTKELKNKLNNSDTSKLNGLNLADILKKLK